MLKQKTVKNLSLYHFQACPFCAVTRRAIHHSNVSVALRDILRNPKYRQELIAGGGKPQVPCLKIELTDGTTHWLYESSDIIQYIHQYHENKLVS